MSDDSDDENNCRYGTPLEPYDEDQVPKKKSAYQDVSEQYALDANGKRRFHGAFTGGFTAGHGNTVGAPEGWTPTAFKSSRSDRVQKTKFQRPEDFMDDEDRSEFGIAPREVRPTGDFGGNNRKRQTQFHDGPIPGQPVLQVLLEPVHETAAMTILRSMGWRPGKGVGERLTKREKVRARKVYSCHIPKEFRLDISVDEEDKPGSSPPGSESSEEEEYSDMLFEPDDFEPYVATPKTNSFGLGYSGLSRHSVLGSFRDAAGGDGEWRGSHLVTSDKGKKVSIRGQAFGVGAMEEEDEDIYAREDLSNYDFALDAAGRSGEKSKGGAKSKQAPPSHRTVLEGFVPAVNKAFSFKVYPPPALPRDFVPSVGRPTRFGPVGEATLVDIPEIRDRGLGRHDLTAKHRGALLGETFTPPSVKDTGDDENKIESMDVNNSKESTMKKSYEERIAAITGRNVKFVSDSNQSKEVEKNDEDKPAVFKPFASNPEKQLRYEKYIEMKDMGKDITSESLQSSGEKNRLMEWERIRELSEFERACRLYKPLTGLMNDRFVSATRPDEDVATTEKHQRDSSLYADPEKLEAARVGMFGKLTREVTKWVPDSMLSRRFNIAEPYGGGMQGKEKKKITYSIFEYLEAPIHNKNSFLREQSGDSRVDKRKENNCVDNRTLSKDIESIAEKSSEKMLKPNDDLPLTSSGIVQPIKAKRLTVAELFLQEKEKERESLLNKKTQLEFQRETVKEKPVEESEAQVKETIDNFNKIDLYKAIFLSDSETDAENETDSKQKGPEKPGPESVNKGVKNPFDSPPRNVERNESPPRGIFANLNYDRLNSWQNSSTRTDDDSIVSISKEPNSNKISKVNEIPEFQGSKYMPSSKEEVDNSADLYGPKLPDKHIFRPKETKSSTEEQSTSNRAFVIDVASTSDSSRDGWVEADKVKSKKSKSKHKKAKKDGKKKHREHRHKSKRKHKSRRKDD